MMILNNVVVVTITIITLINIVNIIADVVTIAIGIALLNMLIVINIVLSGIVVIIIVNISSNPYERMRLVSETKSNRTVVASCATSPRSSHTPHNLCQ